MYQESGSGYIYKTKINRILKSAGLQPKNFNPRKNDPNSIDSVVIVREQSYNIEVKRNLSDVDFGFAYLSYNANNNKWFVAGANDSMNAILDANKINEQINQKWSHLGPPKLFTVEEDKFTFKDAYYDFNKFKPFFLRIPSDSISKYYNGKNTYYMQIGGHGFYYMNANVARVNNLVDLKMEVRLQVRVKRNKSNPPNDYTFSVAMRAVPGTLANTENDLEDPTFLTAISSMSK
jgi:hypothetical protein